jgi:hypothetical protein
MKKPRVSIITSIFNSSKFLFDFLLDVKRQTIFSDCEVLLLDANENDNNDDYKIIKDFAGIENFKYFKIDKCSVYEAWNFGIDVSNSDILTNWNTDDRRSYNSLELQVNFLEKNAEYDGCYGSSIISKIENERFEDCLSDELYHTLDFTLENQLLYNSPHCMPVWRKSIHDICGKFDTSYRSAADYDMWMKVLKNGIKFKKIDATVGLYYLNPIGVSTNAEFREKTLFEELSIRNKYRND